MARRAELAPPGNPPEMTGFAVTATAATVCFLKGSNGAPEALTRRPSRSRHSGPLVVTRCDRAVVRYSLVGPMELESVLDGGHPPPKSVPPAPEPQRVEDGSSPVSSEPPEPPRAAGIPAEVLRPLGRPTWCSEPREPERRRFGSHADPGPAAAEADKGNEDFAFHLELDTPDGQTWILAGVADGVSQGTWAARGARHASAAFIEAFVELSRDPDFPGDVTSLAAEGWSRKLAGLYRRIVIERMERDRDQLLRDRCVDPQWAPALFAKTFWESPSSERELQKWFQTTLLGIALGPAGGFGLFLGDGFVRVDRMRPDGNWQSSSGLEPTRAVSFKLTEAQVFRGIERLARQDAIQMRVLVTTDGVSKSPRKGLEIAMEGIERLPGSPEREPLDQLVPSSSVDCSMFLRKLASLPTGMVDIDNMSVAFAWRSFDSGSKS